MRLTPRSIGGVDALAVRLLVLLVVVTGTVVTVGATPAAALPAKPLTNWSFYITSNKLERAYDLGCNQAKFDTNNGRKNSWVVLDFGAQGKSGTGNLLPGTSTLILTADVEKVSQEFAKAYYVCTGVNTTSRLYLGIGTNNSGSVVTNDFGRRWGTIVTRIKNFVNANYGQVIVYGANDIEPEWHNYPDTLAWAQGFAATGPSLYLNYGSADGCPVDDMTNGTPCANGWTQQNLWYLSYGYGPALVAPEIYTTKDGPRWYMITKYGAEYHSKKIHFTGVWDQYPNDTTTFTPEKAWNALVSLVYPDTQTRDTPGYSMEVHYE